MIMRRRVKVMKKNYVLFLVCMFLFVAAGSEVSGKQPRVAVGGAAVIECADLVATSVIRTPR
jgi:hypothetical protein